MPPRTTIVVIASLLLAGCGSRSDLASVSGRVTLDGRPLEGAVVQFQPVEKGGTSSAGITDADGHYELMFSLSESGAMFGEHRVTIRTADCYYAEVEDMEAEVIPARYHDDSRIRRTVDSSTHVFDFQLDAEPSQ